MGCTNTQRLTGMGECPAIECIISSSVKGIDVDGGASLDRKHCKQIYVDTRIVRLVCAIECIGDVERRNSDSKLAL